MQGSRERSACTRRAEAAVVAVCSCMQSDCVSAKSLDLPTRRTVMRQDACCGLKRGPAHRWEDTSGRSVHMPVYVGLLRVVESCLALCTSRVSGRGRAVRADTANKPQQGTGNYLSKGRASLPYESCADLLVPGVSQRCWKARTGWRVGLRQTELRVLGCGLRALTYAQPSLVASSL